MTSFEDFTIENGERVAQLVIAKHERAEWIEVAELSETSRVLKVSANHIKQKLIIKPAKTRIYKGCPGFKASEKLCKKPRDSL